jgi:hypothetical protein
MSKAGWQGVSSTRRPCNRPGAFQVVTRVTRPLQQQNCITERVVQALLSTARSMGSNIQRFADQFTCNLAVHSAISFN